MKDSGAEKTTDGESNIHRLPSLAHIAGRTNHDRRRITKRKLAPNGGRAGLIVMESGVKHVTLTRTSSSGRRKSQIVQTFANGNDGSDPRSPDTVTLRIERTGANYKFLWQADGGRWNELDHFQAMGEPTADPPRRWIGLVNYNGADGFYFDEFDLQVSQ